MAQHWGSGVQTSLQQLTFEQEGVGCAVKQLAVVASQVAQAVSASVAQSWSHASPQQVGSWSHTFTQQSGSLQYGPAFGSKQLR
jgi:hypothetical protein